MSTGSQQRYGNGGIHVVDVKWERKWFNNIPRFPKKYWTSMDNCKNFMDEIATHSNVISANDWRKVSLALIRRNGGLVNIVYLIL